VDGQAISESFHLAVGDNGPTATAIPDQSSYEGQTFSLDASSHFTAPAAGDALTFSASLPTGLSIDPHTGIISGTPTDSDFGNNPVTVTATDAHGQAISESFHLAVGDSGPTATSIADQNGYEGQTFSLDASSHFSAPAGRSRSSDAAFAIRVAEGPHRNSTRTQYAARNRAGLLWRDELALLAKLPTQRSFDCWRRIRPLPEFRFG
jgi:Putative Ig domain